MAPSMYDSDGPFFQMLTLAEDSPPLNNGWRQFSWWCLSPRRFQFSFLKGMYSKLNCSMFSVISPWWCVYCYTVVWSVALPLLL